MKVKINQDPAFWIKFYMEKFGMTRKEAEQVINPYVIIEEHKTKK